MALLLTGAVLLLLGVALGGVGVYRVLSPALAAAERRASDATDRLVSAWREGYTVPDAVGTPDTAPSRPALDEAVLEFVEQFDEAGQAAWEARARRLMASDPTLTGSDVVRRLERDRTRIRVTDEPFAMDPAGVGVL